MGRGKRMSLCVQAGEFREGGRTRPIEEKSGQLRVGHGVVRIVGRFVRTEAVQAEEVDEVEVRTATRRQSRDTSENEFLC